MKKIIIFNVVSVLIVVSNIVFGQNLPSKKSDIPDIVKQNLSSDGTVRVPYLGPTGFWGFEFKKLKDIKINDVAVMLRYQKELNESDKRQLEQSKTPSEKAKEKLELRKNLLEDGVKLEKILVGLNFLNPELGKRVVGYLECEQCKSKQPAEKRHISSVYYIDERATGWIITYNPDGSITIRRSTQEDRNNMLRKNITSVSKPQ